MNWKQIRAEALKSAREIAQRAKGAGRALTTDETSEFEGLLAKANEAAVQIQAIADSENLYKSLAEIEGDDGGGGEPEDQAAGSGAGPRAKNLGDHFAKEVGGQLLKLKERANTSLGTSEFAAKANTDVHKIGSVFDLVLRDVDRTVVRPYRRPLVTDLFGTGTISGTMVTYFVESPAEGAFTTVAEGAQKPQIHIPDPTTKTDKLTKIAAWFDISDEMVEDLPFMVSEINNRGLRMLAETEERQVLNGDGTGTNLDGVLHRSGIQALTRGAGEPVQDAVFRAIMAVQDVTGLAADGIVIHPTDYQALRLLKDHTGQYLAGGPFQGQYGNGDGLAWQPPLWGVRTVVSPAVAVGTVVVGAFQDAVTQYRKGGVRVESTNSDQGKFTKNTITTRIEERLALAVRVPAAIATVALTP